MSVLTAITNTEVQTSAYNKVKNQNSAFDVEVKKTETETEVDKLESFKQEIWNEIDSMPWDSRMNISIQITDKAFERMMNDDEFKNKMMKVIREESIAAHPPGDVSLTWIDENGYKGYSYIDIEGGHSAFSAHSKDKNCFYSRKSKKEQIKKTWEQEQIKKKQQRERINEEYVESCLLHKEELAKAKQQDIIASYDKSIIYEGMML